MDFSDSSQQHDLPIDTPDLKRPGLLALAIVQAADDSIPIRDYVKELQSHLAQKMRNRTGCSVECTDAGSYWKEKFVESESAQIGLRDRIHELEVRIRTTLRQEGNGSPRSSQLPSSQGRYAEGIGLDLPDQSKQKSSLPWTRGLIDLAVNCTTLDMPYEEQELFNSPLIPSTLLRHLYIIRKCVRQRGPNITALSSTLISLIAIIRTVVQSAGEKAVAFQLSRDKINSPIPICTETLFTALSRTISYLMKGFEKLCKLDSDKSASGHITFQLVALFDVILCQIKDISIAEDKAKPQLSSPAGQTISSQARVDCEISDDLNTRAALCRILVGFVKVIKADFSARNDLLEGYFYIFLKHLAYTIKAVVFQGFEESSKEYSQIPAPRSLERQRSETSTLQCFAPYMAWLMGQIEPDLHSFRSRQNTTTAETNSHTPKTPSALRRCLYQQANIKVQHTLLQAIFEDDQKSFLDSLVIPVYVPDPTMTGTANKDTPKASTEAQVHYIEAVWRLVGWETLGLEDDILGRS